MIGRTVSHYKILEEIGSGGMGVVYKAEDTKLKRLVALKFLPLELMLDETAKARLLHEAHAISALQHHNICTVHEIDQSDNGRMFICMDYYEGETLKERLTRGPLSADDAIDVIVQVAHGLEEAHRRGIVHRDIKPANVVITSQGVVKILDFGLAKLVGQTKITKTGSTVGTAAYMSPEQVRGEDLDQRSDIFSLGVMFHELLTGASPFAAEHEPAVMHKILNVAPPSLRSSGVKHAAQLEPVIGRMLAKEPGLRYASANDVIDDLEKPLHGAGATGKKSRGRVGARRIVVAALLLGGLGAGVFFGWKGPWHQRELKQRQITSNPAIGPASLASLPAGEAIIVSTGVISPDGRTLAVLGRFGLSLRSVDSGESHPVKLPDGFSNELVPAVDWFPDWEPIARQRQHARRNTVRVGRSGTRRPGAQNARGRQRGDHLPRWNAYCLRPPGEDRPGDLVCRREWGECTARRGERLDGHDQHVGGVVPEGVASRICACGGRVDGVTSDTGVL